MNHLRKIQIQTSQINKLASTIQTKVKGQEGQELLIHLQNEILLIKIKFQMIVKRKENKGLK